MVNIILKKEIGSDYNELLQEYNAGKKILDQAWMAADKSKNYAEAYEALYNMTQLKKRLDKMKLVQDKQAKSLYEYKGNKKIRENYNTWQDYQLSDEFQKKANSSRTVYSLNPESGVGKTVDFLGDTLTSAAQGYVVKGGTFALSLPRLAEEGIDFLAKKTAGLFGGEFSEREPIPGAKIENGQAVPRYSTTPFDENYSERASQGYVFPNYEQIQQNITQVIPGAKAAYDFEPSSRLGEYAQTIGEFTTPLTIAGVPSKLMVAAGITGGTTSEYVRENYPDNPLLNIAAPLTAVLTGNYLMNSQRASSLAKKSLKNISKEEILIASELEKIAYNMNIPITANELLESKLLDDIFKLTLRSDADAGLNLEGYLKNRPEDFYIVANNLMDAILKDKNLAKKLNFADIQTMLKDTQKRISKKRSMESQNAGYDIGDTINIEKSLVEDVVKNIDNQLAGSQNPARLKLLNDFKKSLYNADGSLQTNTGKLSETYRRYSELLEVKVGDKALDTELRRLLSDETGKGVWDSLHNALSTNKQWVAGNAKFIELTKAVDDSFSYLKFADGNFDMAKIKQLIFDTDNVNVQDIRNFANLLNKNVKNNSKLSEKIGSKELPYVNFEDPFSTFVDLYMRNIFNKSFTPIGKKTSGKFKPDAGFNFNKELFPNAQSKKNFDEILRQIAKEKGVNPKKLIEGWTNFSKVAEKTGKMTSGQGPQLQQIQTVSGRLLRLGSFMYRVTLGRALDSAVDSKAINTFSNIFTNKASVDALVELANKPNNIRAINTVIGIKAVGLEGANQTNTMGIDEYKGLSQKLIKENNLQVNN